MLIPSPSVVRVAKGEDHQECWRLLLQGFNENGLFGLAPDKVDWFLLRALRPELISPMDTGVRGVVGVIGPVGALEGLCFLTIGEYWYSHDKHIEEFIVFVDPEYRQSTHAKAFIEWMKLQSDTTGIPLLTGIISKERTAAKVRLYERMLPKVGAFFYYNGKGSMASSSAIYVS